RPAQCRAASRRCLGSPSVFFFQAEDGIRDLIVTWSSDVCSSDLVQKVLRERRKKRLNRRKQRKQRNRSSALCYLCYLLFKTSSRSEERRVGKECRSRWSPYQKKRKKKKSRMCGPRRIAAVA